MTALTAATVSRLLAAARHRRSEDMRGARGFHRMSTGFQVTGSGRVEVRYSDRRDHTDNEYKAILDGYAATLAAAGLVAVIDGHGYSSVLVVNRPATRGEIA